MKKILILILFFISYHSFSQNGFKVTTMDSIISTAGPQGAYSITAVEYDGNVHLAYYYGSIDEKWFLRYEVRNNGQRISMENVHEFSKPIWIGGTTAIQFDQDRHPYIYCAYSSDNKSWLTVFTKTDEWSQVNIDYNTDNNWVSSSVNGDHGLGFVTTKPGVGGKVIDYFGYDEDGWSKTTISSSPSLKFKPSSFFAANGDKYIAFMEGTPDTTLLFIYKLTEGGWELDYEQDYPTYYTGDYWTRFGEYNGNVHLLHSLHKQGSIDCAIQHLKKSDGAWQKVNSSNCNDLPHYNYCSGSELEFNNSGNLYWVDEDIVHWIDYNNIYHEFNSPHSGPYYGYFDFVVKNDDLYIYYIAGDKNYPHGDALMFYEAVGSLPDLTNVVGDIPNDSFKVIGISPNPGNGNYKLRLKTDRISEVFIQWINPMGQTINTTHKYIIQPGENILDLKVEQQSQGIYYLKLSTEGNSVSLPVIKQ